MKGGRDGVGGGGIQDANYCLFGSSRIWRRDVRAMSDWRRGGHDTEGYCGIPSWKGEEVGLRYRTDEGKISPNG